MCTPLLLLAPKRVAACTCNKHTAIACNKHTHVALQRQWQHCVVYKGVHLCKEHVSLMHLIQSCSLSQHVCVLSVQPRGPVLSQRHRAKLVAHSC
jgi:hypothetical protein